MMRSLLLFAVLFVATCIQAQVPSYVPTDGLVGWWPFNGNANDESGNGNNGTVNGSTLTTDRYGVANGAYEFDGVNDYIDFESGASSQLNIVGNVTFCFWLRTTSIGGVILSFGDHINSGEAGGFLAGLNHGNPGLNSIPQPGHLSYHINDPWSHSATNVNTDEWRFILVRLNSDSLSLYIDDMMDDLALNMPPMASWNGNRRIGVRNFEMDYFYDGLLDDIGIWNRALTQQEIGALYNAHVGPCVSSIPVDFTGLAASYQTSDASSALVGIPSGGVFIGPGITGDSFDPAAAGLGSHGISYVYIDDDGCVNSQAACTSVEQGIGIGESKMGGGSVRVYPNPNRGQFNVELDLTGLVSLQVFDARGRMVHNEVFTASGSKTLRTIYLSELSAGSYSLQIHNNGNLVSQQVVIE